MATLIDSGTKTTAASEDTLGSAITTAGVYQFVIDTNAMVLGDEIRIRIYTTVLSAGTSRLVQEGPYKNGQGLPIKESIPEASDIEFHVTIQRIAGTDRSYPWKILKL
jgi:hypothetical protein